MGNSRLFQFAPLTCGLLVALLSLPSATAQSPDTTGGFLNPTYVKLLKLLKECREDKAKQEALMKVAEEQLAKAEALLARAKESPDDENARIVATDLAPKAIERAKANRDKARAEIEKLREALQRSELGVTLSERAIGYLKPKGKSPGHKALEWFGRRVSQEVDDEFAKDPGYREDPAALRRINGLIERLLAVSPTPDDRPAIKILAGPVGRLAACATNTTIYVIKDTLDDNPSDEELLFLLGHELSHIQLDHYVAFYARYRGEETLNRLEKLDASDPGNKEELRLAALAARTSSYAVEQELEADVLGTLMAMGAGASARSHYDSLVRRQARYESRKTAALPADNRLKDLIRDHPTPREQLDRLQAVLGNKFWE